MTSNLPLPDQLAEVRLRLKVLEEKEAALRGELLAHPELRTGAEWIAEVRTVPVRRTDWKQVREAAPDLVAEHTYSLPVTRIELSGVDQDTGEIISARAKRAAQETAQ